MSVLSSDAFALSWVSFTFIFSTPFLRSFCRLSSLSLSLFSLSLSSLSLSLEESLFSSLFFSFLVTDARTEKL